MTEKDEWNRDAVSWLEGSPAKEGGRYNGKNS